MHIHRKYVWLIAGPLLASILAPPVLSQTTAGALSKDPSVSGDVAQLKQQVSEQQKQIERLQAIVQQMKQELEQAAGPHEATAPQAQGLGEIASKAPMVPRGGLQAAASPSPFDPPNPAASAAAATAGGSAAVPSLEPEGREAQPKPSPLAFRIGDAEFTPGGFLDFTTFERTTNTGAGIGTSFGSIPYSVIDGTVNPASRLTETRFSAQASRISMKVTSKVDGFNVTGYVEADFLGNNAASMYMTANSSTLRMRQYWIDLVHGKWEILGGQGWSMMTPGRNGISSLPPDLFYSQNADVNYQVGITWVRQAQFRVVYHPSREWAVGVSVENPDQYLTSAVALPGGSSSPYASQFDISGSATSNPNLTPDIVTKVAYDPTLGGKHMHFELGGIFRSFKDYNSSANAKSTALGGGVEAGLNLEVIRNFHLILNGFYGAGGGRYIFAFGPDVVVKPDGTLATVRSGAGVAGLEYQFSKATMLFAYYGGTYFDRAAYVSSYGNGGKPVYVGFGYPGSSNASNRAVQEPTFGLVRTFWKNPRYGALQWISQYSYVNRTPWYVSPGSSKNAHVSMIYATLRYTLP